MRQSFSVKYVLLFSNSLKIGKACMKNVTTLCVRIVVCPNDPTLSLTGLLIRVYDMYDLDWKQIGNSYN